MRANEPPRVVLIVEDEWLVRSDIATEFDAPGLDSCSRPRKAKARLT